MSWLGTARESHWISSDPEECPSAHILTICCLCMEIDPFYHDKAAFLADPDSRPGTASPKLGG